MPSFLEDSKLDTGTYLFYHSRDDILWSHACVSSSSSILNVSSLFFSSYSKSEKDLHLATRLFLCIAGTKSCCEALETIWSSSTIPIWRWGPQSKDEVETERLLRRKGRVISHCSSVYVWLLLHLGRPKKYVNPTCFAPFSSACIPSFSNDGKSYQLPVSWNLAIFFRCQDYLLGYMCFRCDKVKQSNYKAGSLDKAFCTDFLLFKT